MPTKVPEGELPRFRLRIREIAEKAVIRVYEHGAGHERSRYEAERDELARRFRAEFGSDGDGAANVAPYFIGVFDTVASLGAKGPVRIALAALTLALIAGAGAAVASLLHYSAGLHWGWSAVIATAGIGAAALWSYLRTALKVMWPPLPSKSMPTFHLAQWSGRNFDRLLSRSVLYARHAIAIDENRADFPRLPWGEGVGIKRPPKGKDDVEPFIQMWFAGNHSDIGGSYPETESRLSDIALGWMLEEAASVPHPLVVDADRLKLYPSADGLQHDEIAGMSDTIRAHTPGWLRGLTRKWSWKETPRAPKHDAVLHPSVNERFRLPSVLHQGGEGPYRPEPLRNHKDLQWAYAATKDAQA